MPEKQNPAMQTGSLETLPVFGSVYSFSFFTPTFTRAVTSR
jgi:hypothetical protein